MKEKIENKTQVMTKLHCQGSRDVESDGETCFPLSMRFWTEKFTETIVQGLLWFGIQCSLFSMVQNIRDQNFVTAERQIQFFAHQCHQGLWNIWTAIRNAPRIIFTWRKPFFLFFFIYADLEILRLHHIFGNMARKRSNWNNDFFFYSWTALWLKNDDL